ncbi:MAG: hypothetical protein EOO05_08020, partial [Chitinophagaceae bacterium]
MKSFPVLSIALSCFIAGAAVAQNPADTTRRTANQQTFTGVPDAGINKELNKPDTIPGKITDPVTLDEVRIRAFEQNRDQYSGTVVVNILGIRNADRVNKMSLVNGMNSIAGVRMEERSPGSYRLNIRGSSLRSPFGVRNVKVYWNDIPVTDPSGNTYFNQFAYNNFSDIEVFRGPSSSLYGAGTGGLILVNNFEGWKPGASAEYITGSYNLQNVLASARFGSGDNRNQVTYAHNASNGY